MNLNYFLAPIAAALFCLNAGVSAQAVAPKYRIVAYYLSDTAAHNFTPADIKANIMTYDFSGHRSKLAHDLLNR